MRRTLVAAAVAATVVLGAAQTAAAQTYNTTSTTTQGQYKLNQGANARVLASDADSLTMSVECFANASPPAEIVSIGVRKCYVVGADNAVHDIGSVGSNPGFFTVTGGLIHEARRQHYRVCVQSVTFVKANFTIEAPLSCSP